MPKSVKSIKGGARKATGLKRAKGGRLGDANKLSKRLQHGKSASTVWMRASQTARAH
jgi:hypothetical protein